MEQKSTYTTAKEIISQLTSNIQPEVVKHKAHFFQAFPGGYGEGDFFCGANNPRCHDLVKQMADFSLKEIRILLWSKWHEARLCALFWMVVHLKKSEGVMKEKIPDLYLKGALAGKINQWDLVDLSAADIMGKYEYELQTHELSERFAQSNDLWLNRIAIVSTYYWIRKNDFDMTLRLCTKFLNHPHDLMHKACGWMLREVGKRDKNALTHFLNKNKINMPRTMLRYAIEHYSKQEREMFLKK